MPPARRNTLQGYYYSGCRKAFVRTVDNLFTSARHLVYIAPQPLPGGPAEVCCSLLSLEPMICRLAFRECALQKSVRHCGALRSLDLLHEENEREHGAEHEGEKKENIVIGQHCRLPLHHSPHCAVRLVGRSHRIVPLRDKVAAQL